MGFTLLGALYLQLKASGDVLPRAKRWFTTLWVVELVAFVLLIVASYTFSGVVKGFGLNAGLVLIVSFVLLALVRVFVSKGKDGLAFVFGALSVLLATASIFVALFPNVMVSSTDPAFNLTIYNASSSPYTLGVMTKVALIMVPIVLAYTAWSYWIFRKRISTKVEDLKY
ncbi:hypothetical protein SDC9_126785 [bioreactor metagenome]|uniref:Cytochrome bd-I ubiquinol oxidase subunit 2 n=1 Tax=bioreactor metagenome TaxID=1076179 RepID=A0A645CS70_9ZZZZ